MAMETSQQRAGRRRSSRTVALSVIAMPSALFAAGVATAVERPAPGEIDPVTIAAAAGGAAGAWLIVTLVSRWPRSQRTRRVTSSQF